MRRSLLILLLLAFLVPAFPQEAIRYRTRRGEAAGYASRDATVLSMMGWGVTLAVGIATLCALIHHNSSGSSGHAH